MEQSLEQVELSLEKVMAEKGLNEAKRHASLAFVAAAVQYAVSLSDEDRTRLKEIIQTDIKPVLKAAASTT